MNIIFKKQKHLFEIEILQQCNIFTVTFDQYIASLQNKSK